MNFGYKGIDESLSLFILERIMKVDKVYIIRIDNPTSIEYAQTAAESCERVGHTWEYFEGFDGSKIKDQSVWKMLYDKGIQFGKMPSVKGPAACASASHYLLWKHIADNKECSIILEHDALMLHRFDLEVPDNTIIVLGYKVVDPQKYDYQTAGQPKFFEQRKKHGGAHAYAINHITATSLLNNIKNVKKNMTFIDNEFFFRNGTRGSVDMAISNPISAIGWLRKSTIWKQSAVDNYRPILDSFRKHYHSNESLGEKNA